MPKAGSTRTRASSGAVPTSQCASSIWRDRKSTRLNSSHTEIYTLSLHDALPICRVIAVKAFDAQGRLDEDARIIWGRTDKPVRIIYLARSEEHTSELQSHRDLHSFPTRRSSDLPRDRSQGLRCPRQARRGRAHHLGPYRQASAHHLSG